MIRNKIVFQVRGHDMLTAVGKKLAHHEDRLAYWEGRQAILEAEMRANGVTFESNEIRANTTYHGSGAGLDIKFDPLLKKNMDDAADKVREHRGLVGDYTLWRGALEANPARLYDIDMDDWEHFGL